MASDDIVMNVARTVDSRLSEILRVLERIAQALERQAPPRIA